MMMAAKGKADGTVMDRSDGPCPARWINGSEGMVTASRLLGASRLSSSSIRQQVRGREAIYSRNCARLFRPSGAFCTCLGL